MHCRVGREPVPHASPPKLLLASVHSRLPPEHVVQHVFCVDGVQQPGHEATRVLTELPAKVLNTVMEILSFKEVTHSKLVRAALPLKQLDPRICVNPVFFSFFRLGHASL